MPVPHGHDRRTFNANHGMRDIAAGGEINAFADLRAECGEDDIAPPEDRIIY